MQAFFEKVFYNTLINTPNVHYLNKYKNEHFETLKIIGINTYKIKNALKVLTSDFESKDKEFYWSELNGNI